MPGRAAALLVAALAVAGVAALTGLALAKSTATLLTADNSALGETVVVSTNGHTVYALRPETTHHLLCKNSTCFGFWPPLKVSKNAKLTDATGIKGKLGKLHRDGFYQVTLGGDPLYNFKPDKKGQAAGNGIKSFGGTWHVIAVGKKSGGTPTTTTTTSTTTTSSSTTTSTYTYPYP
jgi:predicted lipoprotein with Yx(FWY)xxD motif